MFILLRCNYFWWWLFSYFVNCLWARLWWESGKLVIMLFVYVVCVMWRERGIILVIQRCHWVNKGSSLSPGEGKQLQRSWRQCGSALLASNQPRSVCHSIRRQDHSHLGRPHHQMHRHRQYERWDFSSCGAWRLIHRGFQKYIPIAVYYIFIWYM